MRRYGMVGLAALLLTISCTDGKPRQESEDNVGTVVETVGEAAPDPEEAPDAEEALIAEEPMPLAADELFDDFIFNFAASKKLQMERIAFPLPVRTDEQTDTVRRGQWRMDYFFMRQDYYTLIFNSEHDMERVKDTAVSEAIVEKIHLDKASVQQYLFRRTNGRWMLREVRNQAQTANPNASFLEFYRQFVADSAFQTKSLAQQISFVGPDPDDDFAQMEGVITPDFWDAFCPELPTGMLYNIVYGQQPAETDTRIFVVRGIANGQELELTFQRQGGRWLLTKMIM